MLKIKNPYPGFHNGIHRAYEVEEAELFYGRDQDISNIKLRLRQNRLVALLSIPKGGKTSFLKAGVMADFDKNLFNGINGPRWKSVYFTPDRDPVLSMARAIVNPKSFLSEKIKPSMEEEVLNKLTKNDYGLIRVAEDIIGDQTYNLLMVIDDFAELFTRKVENKRRTQFINLILKAIKSNNLGFYCIISMNLEELSNRDLKDFEDLYKSVMKGNYQLRFLDQMGLRDAIEIPAKVEKSEVENELSLQLIEELISDSDQLRKLQIYMSRTWFEWKKNHKNKFIEVSHFMKATGQRQKTVLGKGEKASKGLGIKIKSEEESSYNQLSTGNMATNSIIQDYEMVDQGQQRLIERMLMVTIKKEGKELSVAPKDLEQMVDILGVKQNELIKLINEVPSILNIDRKQVQISNIEALQEWPKAFELIEEEEEGVENYKLLADAAILHYIDGIDIDSVFSKEQYEKVKIWYDDFMPTEEWTKLYHKQYELAIDFIGKLEETYGPVSRPKPKPKAAPVTNAPQKSAPSEISIKKPLKLVIKKDNEPTVQREVVKEEFVPDVLEQEEEFVEEPAAIESEKEFNSEYQITQDEEAESVPVVEKKIIKPIIATKKIVLKGPDEEDHSGLKKKIVIKKK